MTLVEFARVFLSRTRPDPSSECVLYVGGTDGRKGYGRTRIPAEIASVLDTPSKKTAAHRASFVLFRGAFDPSLQLDHLCRRKNCVNPYHLEVVTIEENAERANEVLREIRKNRSAICDVLAEELEEGSWL